MIDMRKLLLILPLVVACHSSTTLGGTDASLDNSVNHSGDSGSGDNLPRTATSTPTPVIECDASSCPLPHRHHRRHHHLP